MSVRRLVNCRMSRLAAALLCVGLLGPQRMSSALATSAPVAPSYSRRDGQLPGLALPPPIAGQIASAMRPQRTAAWPFSTRRYPSLSNYGDGAAESQPHPAVARIIVPEREATAFGSGTLIDVREQYGLVVTNWHVVSDSHGVVEVVFPNGFRSQARPLKVDSDWDLAALVIWRPPIEPVKLASQPPRPGDTLTIHGYGQGQYRAARGRCTSFYAPRPDFPLEMLELDVEARQGDSGGPILNDRGELAGVLFGAGQGTTLGSFAPRVSSFLATLAPDIGQVTAQQAVAVAERPAPLVHPASESGAGPASLALSSPWCPPPSTVCAPCPDARAESLAVQRPPDEPHEADESFVTPIAVLGKPMAVETADNSALTWDDLAGNNWFEPAKSALALIGLAAIVLQLVKMVR